MLDFPSVQHGESRSEDEDPRSSPKCFSSPRSPVFFPQGMGLGMGPGRDGDPMSPRSLESRDDMEGAGQGAGQGVGVRWSGSEHPTPRSLVIGISVNIIKAMKMYQAQQQQHAPHTDGDHGNMEEENSNISSATLKKLSKLSSLPHRSENLDFLSASFPHLPVKSNSPLGENPNGSNADEEEEDEI